MALRLARINLIYDVCLAIFHAVLTNVTSAHSKTVFGRDYICRHRCYATVTCLFLFTPYTAHVYVIDVNEVLVIRPRGPNTKNYRSTDNRVTMYVVENFCSHNMYPVCTCNLAEGVRRVLDAPPTSRSWCWRRFFDHLLVFHHCQTRQTPIQSQCRPGPVCHFANSTYF